jgi:hypothetical protein
MGVGGQCQSSAAFPPKITQQPVWRRLGGPQGKSGLVRNTSPPTGIRSSGRSALACRYTDWAIPAHMYTKLLNQNFRFKELHKK